MEHKHRSISLADQIFEKLEQDILSGKYSRGEILTEMKLSEELGVSRTPIREALRRLSQERIIEEVSKGSRVLGISTEDLEDIFKIRLNIEGTCAAMTAKNITDEQLSELREVVDMQEFYISKENVDNIRAMDSRFHELLYKFSGSNIFYDILYQLHRKTHKYRRVAVSSHEGAIHSLEEHRKIFEAIADHNEELASEVMIKHIQNAKARLVKKIEE